MIRVDVTVDGEPVGSATLEYDEARRRSYITIGDTAGRTHRYPAPRGSTYKPHPGYEHYLVAAFCASAFAKDWWHGGSA